MEGRGEAPQFLLGAALLLMNASAAWVLKRVLLLLSQLGAQVIYLQPRAKSLAGITCTWLFPETSCSAALIKKERGGEYSCPGGVGGLFEMGLFAVGLHKDISAITAAAWRFWMEGLGVSGQPGCEHPAGPRAGFLHCTHGLQQGRSRPLGLPALI